MNRRRKSRLIPRVLLALFVLAFLGVTVGGGVAVGVLLAHIDQPPPIKQLEDYKPPESTFVFDSQGQTRLAEFLEERRYVLSIKQIPDLLVKAFLAVEDQRFYGHFGVDPIGVLRAALKNFLSGAKGEGASTISMQLPRNFGELGREKTYERKLREMLLALQVEHRYSKEQILEFYLNQIDFVHNSYGVEAAAKTYFGKTVQELTLGECSVLAGIPKAPSVYNPISHLDKATERRNIVLGAMLSCGYITQEQHDKAVSEPIVVRKAEQAIEPYRAPYFIDYLQSSLLASPDYVPEDQQGKVTADTYLKTGGFRIISTLDLELQRVAEEVMKEGLINAEHSWHKSKAETLVKDEKQQESLRAGQDRLGEIVSVGADAVEVQIQGYRGAIPRPAHPPFHDPDAIFKPNELLDVKIESVDYGKRRFTGHMLPENKLKGAMVVVEAHTGRVLALVGGEDYYDTSDDKRQFNFATQGGRQPGSGIKPLFYAAAIANGFTPNRRFLNVPFYIGNYIGRNYSRTHEGGEMTMFEGLERSQNVMMLRVYQALGFKKAVDFVSQFDYAWPESRWDKQLLPQASICLGTMSVTPLEMAAAYTAIANEGTGIRPYAVDRIESRDGKTIYQTKPFRKVIMTPQQAFVELTIMKGVLGPRGTAWYGIGDQWQGRKDLPEMAGKTGTTDETKDAWFNGITPDLVISLYVGFDPPRPLGYKLTGATLAGPIFKAFVEKAIPLRTDWTMKFAVPEGVVMRDICLKSGKLAGKWCGDGDSVARMAFVKDTEPTQVCDGMHN
ncbi:MAG: transglycosylase domain-containing protein [Candidatus Sumerlaeota bacterium]|nr:transglycosylase domain-containing protein [Candidatus Sumerlaeota bacterium]